MKVTPVSPTYKPRWVFKKPLYPVDSSKMELRPIEVKFVETVQPIKHERINWVECFLIAVAGALVSFVLLTGLIAIITMVIGA